MEAIQPVQLQSAANIREMAVRNMVYQLGNLPVSLSPGDLAGFGMTRIETGKDIHIILDWGDPGTERKN